MSNKNLAKAKKEKNDEFYTKLDDVSNELCHYDKHFKNKIVFCNCDDPTTSAFWKYFHLKFQLLGLKKLISTHYERDKFSYKLEYEGGNDNDVNAGVQSFLSGNGDFRSEECIELLKEADVVVTNPPFSLFRDYIELLVKYNKKFLIIGNKNSITYKEMFPIIKDNRVWLGYNSPDEFDTPNGTIKKVSGLCRWFTNLDIRKRHEDMILWESYDPIKFPKYDNYDAIDIGKYNKKGKRVGDVNLIPKDYFDVMGVPITFLDKYNPEQFELLGLTCRGYSPEYNTKIYSKDIYKDANDLNGSACISRNGKLETLYGRLLIKRRQK